MSQYDVYLAGAMTGRTIKEVLKERQTAKRLLSLAGLTYYDPSHDEGLERQSPNKLISNAFDKRRMKHFVSKDLAAVAQSKYVLNLTGDLPSDGTNWEMAYAIWYRHIPVHIVAPKRHSGFKMSFTNILVDGVHQNLVSAIKAIQKLKENS